MTEPPTDLALQAALKDFLVYQNAARRKHEREEFFRSCNLGLCILLGMALAVVTVHFTANLLWAILVLLATLLCWPGFSPRLSSLAIPSTMRWRPCSTN